VLPSHMVPRIFFPLRNLPLTVSGKVNRRVLREMGARVPAAQFAEFSPRATAKREPSTPTEKVLQTLWSQVLSLTPSDISVNDTFFDLGGDSLSAMRLSVVARDAGLSLRVADVFAGRTLSEMADKYCQAHESRSIYKPFSNLQDTDDLDALIREHIAPRVNVHPSEIEDVATATDLQTQMVVASQLKERYTIYYLTLDLEGELDAVRLKDACMKVVAHYPILRTVFVYYKARLLQAVIRSPHIEFEEYSVYADIEGASADYISRDKQQVSPITQQGVRFALLRSDEASRLLVRLPHAQYDAVSLPLVLSALRSSYAQSETPLPPSPSFFAFLHAVQSTQAAAEQFWQTQLSSARMTDIITRPATSEDSKTVTPTYPLRSTLTRYVPAPPSDNDCASNHAFPTVLKAAWAATLASLSSPSTSTGDEEEIHNDAIVFGETLANRAVPLDGVDAVVGPCMITAPVVVRRRTLGLSDADLLAAVAKQEREAAAHRLVRFGDLGLLEGSKRFSSTVAHMELDAVKLFEDQGDTDEAGTLKGEFGEGLRCKKVGWVGDAWDSADVAVETTPALASGKEGRAGVRVALHFCEELVPNRAAEALVDRLCKRLQQLWT
jgi:hypothetical protein